MLAGLLPNKFCAALKGETPRLKDYTFEVSATRGWNEAEFTAGGVDTTQVREGTLESKIVKGVYFAGEVLDVCGARGGYNLAWAWASGLAAGAAGRA
jgi:predicted flavoprotein YhiN